MFGAYGLVAIVCFAWCSHLKPNLCWGTAGLSQRMSPCPKLCTFRGPGRLFWRNSRVTDYEWLALLSSPQMHVCT